MPTLNKFIIIIFFFYDICFLTMFDHRFGNWSALLKKYHDRKLNKKLFFQYFLIQIIQYTFIKLIKVSTSVNVIYPKVGSKSLTRDIHKIINTNRIRNHWRNLGEEGEIAFFRHFIEGTKIYFCLLPILGYYLLYITR